MLLVHAHIQLHDSQAIRYGIWQVRPRVTRFPHEPGGVAGRTSLPHGPQGQWAWLVFNTDILTLTWNQDQLVCSQSTCALCSRSHDSHGYLSLLLVFWPTLNVGTDGTNCRIVLRYTETQMKDTSGNAYYY
jgi:hypothetical protein